MQAAEAYRLMWEHAANTQEVNLRAMELLLADLRYLAAIRETERALGREERLGMAGKLHRDPTLTPGDHPYPYRLDEGAAVVELATGEYR
jgi:hypothetical protein